MKPPLRHRWALFVQRHSPGPAWPYGCLLLTIVLGILQFTKHAHLHFLLIMVVLTVMMFERWAFVDLLTARDREIEKLGRERKGAG